MTAPVATDNRIAVNIDGTEVRVPPGTNMIEAAALLKKEVPHYCYHPKLSVVGNCRMCLVEMGMVQRDPKTREVVLDDKGQPKVGWMPRPAIACATTAAPGLYIKTDSPMVKQCREGVMEFLLVNHPLDCPICDQAGECRLQEFATDYGRGFSRFIEQKNVKPKRTVLGPRVMLDDERCILCSRCVRFSQEIAKDDVLGFVDRGSYSTLTCYPGKKLENNYSLNTVDICPVGALTSIDFRFKMRVWFLKETPSIDTESSTGANTLVSSREGVIYRITPRRNDEVNDTWMTDSARLLYKQVRAENRLKNCTVDGLPATPARAAEVAAQLLAAGGVSVVGSGRASVEEQYLLKKIAVAAGQAPVALVSRTGEGDGILLSADRNPNVRGALVTGLIGALPEAKLTALGQAIDAGQVKTVLTHGECLLEAGLTAEQLAKVQIIALGSHGNETTRRAKVVLAGLTVFEKAGSFVNQQFRLQKFAVAVPGPAGVLADGAGLVAILGSLTQSKPLPATPLELWQVMARDVAALQGVTWERIGATGLLLDGSPWEALPFVEGRGLKFTPKKRVPAMAAATA